MQMRIWVRGFMMATMLCSTPAMAQESEFKGKMQEDLDFYKDRLKNSCNIEVAFEWTGGALGHNPREAQKPEVRSLSTNCSEAIQALYDTCQTNAPVKKAVARVNKIECKRGRGPMSYTLKGPTLVFVVDASYSSASGTPGWELAAKMKKDLDK